MSLTRAASSSVEGAAARSRAEAMSRISNMMAQAIRYNKINPTIDPTLVVILLMLHGFCATIPASEDLSIDTRWPLSLGRSFATMEHSVERNGAARRRGTSSWVVGSDFTFHFHVYFSRSGVLSGRQSEDLCLTEEPLLPCLVLRRDFRHCSSACLGAAAMHARWL